MTVEELTVYTRVLYSVSSAIHLFRSEELHLECGVVVNTAGLSTMNVIDQNPKCCVTELGKIMGLSKGAISQMATKLLHKELIRKTKLPGNAKVVYLELTEKGKMALEEYRVIHNYFYNGMDQILDTYSEQEREMILSFLKRTNELVDERRVETQYIPKRGKKKWSCE